MPFYVKKSLSFGPIRFNLSKSGVGVSAGIKGLRFGSGPRGNYVHLGRGGLYYRSSLSPSRAPASRAGRVPQDALAVNSEGLQEIESGDVLKMVDSSSKDLLGELNSKLELISTYPWVLGSFACLVAYLLYRSSPPWLVGLAALVGAICFAASCYYDYIKRTTVIMFELDPDAEAKYRELHEAFDQLCMAEKVWNVEATSLVGNVRHSAGAASVAKRSVVRLSAETPPKVCTNVSVAMIPAGRQKLYLFPDKVLVYASNGIGAVSYHELEIDISQDRFVEQGAPPSDANVVDRTWRYVNKSGDPDRRFNDNRELPVVLYETIHLKSGSGLNELFQVSKPGLVNRFRSAIQALAVS